MKKILVSLFAGLALVGVCAAQSAQSQTSTAASQSAAASAKNAQVATASQLQAGSTMQAELVKPVDCRKNKVGDEVIAKTTHDVKSEGRVVIPKGSKLVGHVTEAKARSKDQATSELGVAFDHAILKNGTEMPVALSIQAIGASQASAAAMENDTMATGGGGGTAGTMRSSPAQPSGGGGMLGGVQSTAGGVVNTAGSTAGTAVNSTTGVAATAGGSVSGPLSPTSHGIIGMPGLSLSTQSATSGNASVISSQGGNVHLDSGTEMILMVNQ